MGNPPLPYGLVCLAYAIACCGKADSEVRHAIAWHHPDLSGGTFSPYLAFSRPFFVAASTRDAIHTYIFFNCTTKRDHSRIDLAKNLQVLSNDGCSKTTTHRANVQHRGDVRDLQLTSTPLCCQKQHLILISMIILEGFGG